MTFCMHYAPYSFTRRFKKDGSMTRWYSIYTFLKEHGPASKEEIVNAIYEHRGKGRVIRGFCSNAFAQMNYQGVCIYNKSTRKWEAGTLPKAA